MTQQVTEPRQLPLDARVEKAIDLMRPYLQTDGIQVSLEYIEGKTLFLSIQTAQRMSGAEIMMYKLGIEKKLLEQFKEFESTELM